jgi:hypothetical protein
MCRFASPVPAYGGASNPGLKFGRFKKEAAYSFCAAADRDLSTWRQRLALRIGFLDPIIHPARIVTAVAYLGDDAFQPDAAGMLEQSGPIDLEAFTNWIAVLLISFLSRRRSSRAT